jgi:hypothetical protein
LARHDLNAASRLLDRISEASEPKDGALRPNPMQSAAAGRYHLAGGAPEVALPYLELAAVEALPPAQRVPTLLAYARARGAVGDRKGAEATLNELLAAQPSAEQREVALVELGQLLLASDPRRALSQIQPVLGSADPTRRLDALLVSIHAQALLGDRKAAAGMAQQAWPLVPEVSPHGLAGMRLALVSGALAAADGDRDRAIALLGLANPDALKIDPLAGNVLPLCGEAGLEPDDYLTVTVTQDTIAAEQRIPVSASRPAAVAPFLDAFAGRALLNIGGPAPAGTVLTLRCRAAPSATYVGPPLSRDPAHAWLAARGLHQSTTTDATDESINRLADRIDVLAATLGTDHPRLIPLRWALARNMEERAASGGAIEEWQITRLRQQVNAAMRRAGAGDLVPSEADEAIQRRIAATSSPEEGLPLVKQATLGRIREGSPVVADFFYRQWRLIPILSNADKTEVATAFAERFAKDPASARVRPIYIQLADLARERGDLPEMRRWHRKAALGQGLCETTDEALRVETQPMTDEDYPVDALAYGIEGASQIEFDLAADGTVARHRILIAAPSLLFDEVVKEKTPAFRLSRPLFGGKAAACRGYVTRVIWRVPHKDEEDPAPVFQESDPGNS